MLEWVDKVDLKSTGYCSRAGSSPVRGTNYFSDDCRIQDSRYALLS